MVIFFMAKKSSKKRGRPPQFVRDKEGRIVYGLSSQSIIKNGRQRTRYYATFSKTPKDKRVWFGMDNFEKAAISFLTWLESNGSMDAYLRKTDQGYLIPMYHHSLRLIGVDIEEATNIPDWLKGRKVRSIPLNASGTVSRARYFSYDINHPVVHNLIKQVGLPELSDSARSVLYVLIYEFQMPEEHRIPDLLRIGKEQLNIIRRAVRDGSKWRPLTLNEIDNILPLCEQVKLPPPHMSV